MGLGDDELQKQIIGLPTLKLNTAANLPGVGVAPPPAAPTASPVGVPPPPGAAGPTPRIGSAMNQPEEIPRGTLSMGMPHFPGPLEQRKDQLTQQQHDLDRGSGVSQIQNPFVRTIARIGDVAGTILAPRIAAAIPGTTLHHQVLQGQNTAQLGQLENEQEKEAEVPLKQAQTEEAQARAGALENPPERKPTLQETDHGLVMVSPEGQATPVTMGGEPLKKSATEPKGTVHETDQGLVMVSPDGKTVTPIQMGGQTLKGAPKTGDDFEKYYQDYLADNNLPDSAHNRLMARKQMAIASQAPQRPAQVTIINPQGQVQTVHPGDTIAPGSVTPGGLSSESVSANKQAETEKKGKADAQKEYQLAQNLASNPSPTNDLALVMRYVGATKPDSLSKLRLNNNEVNLVYGTRSSLGDIEALVQKVQNGQSLTPQQRQDMLDTMKILANAGNEGGGGGGSSLKVGAPVTIKGKQMKVTAVHPDGSFDAQ